MGVKGSGDVDGVLWPNAMIPYQVLGIFRYFSRNVSDPKIGPPKELAKTSCGESLVRSRQSVARYHLASP
jgi:hypothetical protein